MRYERRSSPRLPVRALALVSLLAVTSSGKGAVERGRDLFRGREALAARLRHHQSDLPPQVVACSNCHAVEGAPPPSASRAPRIDRALLLEARARRGGPPSAYGASSFCRLLRTGIDPAHVLIAREMPVYAADDPQCQSLWAFAIRRKEAP